MVTNIENNNRVSIENFAHDNLRVDVEVEVEGAINKIKKYKESD